MTRNIVRLVVLFTFCVAFAGALRYHRNSYHNGIHTGTWGTVKLRHRPGS